MAAAALRHVALRRRGLTLLELIVVLVVLIAAAGIVLPLLPNMLGRAETSSGATNIAEVSKWVQTYEMLNSLSPMDWDALVDNTGTPYPFLDPVTIGDIAVDSGLTAAEATALNSLTSAPVWRLQLMNTALVAPNTNITFSPYPTTGAPPVPVSAAANGLTPAAGVKLLILTPQGQQKMNFNSDGTTNAGKYLVFGFGARAQLVGQTVADAPVAFRDDGGKTPDQSYCRYGVVYKVSTNASGTSIPLSRGRFAGVIDFRETGIATTNNTIQEYYNLNAAGS
jgi:type II secretory pathway pseudopilin PulG